MVNLGLQGLSTERFWFLVRDLPEDGILVGSSQVAASLAELLVVEQLAVYCGARFPAAACPKLPRLSGFCVILDQRRG
jgi:hypothetical protein